MKRVHTERAIAIILSLAATGCARFPTDKTAPINQTARFFGVGWSDGYHECNQCYRQGNLLAGRMGCGHCGVATCNGCGGESNYLVQQFTPQAAPANPPAAVLPLCASNAMNGGQPIVPPKSNAPMPPMMMSPLLPEAVPTKTEKSRTDANKSLLTEPAEVVQPERADPPSPSDKKGTRLPSEEELKPKQPSERIEFPTPGDKSPKVDDDDLLSYVPRTPQNMVYHSAPLLPL